MNVDHIPRTVLGMKTETVISIVVIGAGVVYGYSQLSGKVDGLVDKQASINDTLKAMQSKDDSLQAQINNQRDLGTVRQIDISTKMTRLETILERLDGKTDRFISIVPKSQQ